MAETRDPVIELLENTRRDTEELISALFDVQFNRMRDIMGRDLRDQTAQIVETRFSQLELTLRPRMARARLEVARGVAQVLAECFGRMRRFESDRHWCEAMLDATASMSRRSAFFSVRGKDLCLQGVRGLDPKSPLLSADVPVTAAPAFERVLSSGRAVQAARSAAELSMPIAAIFGHENDGRAFLVPVIAEEHVPGVLYAEDAVDPAALEVIAGLAGATLEKHLKLFEPVRASAPSRPVAVRAAAQEPPDLPVIPVDAPPRDLDPASLAAHRFARVAAAQLLLRHASKVSRGRRGRNLYALLKQEIELLRSQYRARFAGVADHLDSELVRTLALGDKELFGRGYPAPMA